MIVDDAGFDAREALALLVEEIRLRVVAAMALGSRSLDDITRATGLDAKEAGRALTRLQSAGVVEREGGAYVLNLEEWRLASRRPAEHAAEGSAPEEAKVLRSFFRRGRLVSIPVQLGKRIVVLDHIAQAFEPGRRYSEREVNEILHSFHDDHATLRRCLVEEELLHRDHGVYWRVGGTYMPD